MRLDRRIFSVASDKVVWCKLKHRILKRIEYEKYYKIRNSADGLRAGGFHVKIIWM